MLRFDFEGNERRGLTEVCRRGDGATYAVAASEVAISRRTKCKPYLASDRKWMGIAPLPPSIQPATRRKTTAPAAEGPVELVVLSIKQQVARCRLLVGDQTVTLRSGRLWNLVPRWIAVVKRAKPQAPAGNSSLSGVIETTRLDVKALWLVPLRLEQAGVWDPAGHCWGEAGDPIENWAKPIIADGPRSKFEMEQVLPGLDAEDPFSDPVGQSNYCR